MNSILDLIYIPIVNGRLQGKKWLVNAGGKILRILLGTYEPEQTALFEKLISGGNTVLDIGANAGYYTLLSSVLVKNEGQVYAFEPNPINIHYLNRNIKVNKIKNVRIIEKAVSNEDGYACFENNTGRGTGYITQTGSIKVETINLDKFINENNIKPSHIKIDVEGAEFDVLTGAKGTLSGYKPVIFLSTHGKEVCAKCHELLKSMNYDIKPIAGHEAEFICHPA